MKLHTRIPLSIGSVLFALLLVIVMLAPLASANNPISVKSDGTPVKWASFPITYTVDGGTLGALSNAQANALVSQAFGAWSAVSTATVTTTQNATPGLGSDGDINTIGEYNTLNTFANCIALNPIVYDTDGTLTDALLGAGASNSILGFAGPCAITVPGGVIEGGHATLNGHLITSTSGLAFSEAKGTFIHEFGHLLGLGHAQVNVNCFTVSTCASGSADLNGLPTMFPTLFSGRTESPNTSYSESLAADDISAISTLYPSAGFATATGTISGTVLFSDQINHAQGVNVIARRVGDPRVTAISNVSGMFAQVDHGNAALGTTASTSGSTDVTKRGAFTIPGLPPGTYTVEVESVNSSFTGGSGVGPLSQSAGRDENIPVPGVAECYGGPESSTDDPAICQNLVIAAGTVLNNINFILNDTFTSMDAFDTAARNESIATATSIGNGSTSDSMSGLNGSDVDFYKIPVTAGQTLTVETTSRRLVPGRFLDSVIDLMDSSGTRLNTCRAGDTSGTFTNACINDNFTPSGGSLTLDSKLQFSPATSGFVYLRVSDRFGDARPDFLYSLTVSGAASGTTINFTGAASDGGKWETPGNWDAIPARIPNSSDIVGINSGQTATISGPTPAVTVTAINYASGGSVVISGSSLTFTSTSTANNLTVSGGTLTANAQLTISGTTTLSSGIFTGSGHVIANGLFTWTGGTLSGTPGTFDASGGIDFNGGVATGSSHALVSRTLNLAAGTASFSGQSESIFLGGAAVLHIPVGGTLAMDVDGGSNGQGFFDNGGGGTISNDGTIRKLAGNLGTTAFNNPIVLNLNAGSHLEALSGTIIINGGGTANGATFLATSPGTIQFNNSVTTDAGTAITGTGKYLFSSGTMALTGTYNVTGDTTIGGAAVSINAAPVAINTIHLVNGTLGGSATLSPTGMFTWTGGTLSGTSPAVAFNIGGGGIDFNGGVATGSSHALVSRTLNLAAGTTSFSGQNESIFLGGAAVLHIPVGGTLALDVDGGTSGQGFFDNGGGGTISNDGTIRKLAGNSGFTQFNNPIVLNLNVGSHLEALSGTVLLNGGATANGATFLATSPGIMQFNNSVTTDAGTSLSGTGNYLFSSGTMTLTGTYNVTGDTTISGAAVSINAAPVAINTIHLVNGTLGGSATLSPTGKFTWTGGTLSGTSPAVAFNIGGGGIDFNGGVATGSSHALVSRTLNLAAGTTSFSGQNESIFLGGAAVLHIPVGGTLAMDVDSGTNGQGFFDNGGGGTISNDGTIRKLAGNSGFTQFNNPIVLNLNAGSHLEALSGTVLLNGGATANGATFLATSPGIMQFNNSVTTDAGTSLSGTGNYLFSSGTMTLTGTYNVTGDTTISGAAVSINAVPAAINTIHLTNGTLGGSATLSPTGKFTWTGGTLSGTSPAVAFNIGGGGIDFNGGVATGSSHALVSRTLNLAAGTTSFSGQNESIFLGGAAVLHIPVGGTLAMDVDGGTNGQGFFDNGGGGTISNDGTIRKLAGNSGFTQFNNPIVLNLNAGSHLEALSGTVLLNGGATANGATFLATSPGIMQFNNSVTTDAGTSLSGTGNYLFSSGTMTLTGTYNVTGDTTISGAAVSINAVPVAINTIHLTNGTLGGSATLSPTGKFTWTGGTLAGTSPAVAFNIGGGGIDFNGGVATGSSHALVSRTLNLAAGTTSFSGQNESIFLGGAAVLHIPVGGTLAMDVDSGTNGQGFFDNGGGGTISNDGTIRKLAGNTGTTSFNNPILTNNAGTIEALSGTMSFNGGLVQTGGVAVTRLNGGAITAASGITINGGLLTGNGTITGSVANNGGTVAPGLSPGSLTITGNYTQGAGGTLSIEIGGTAGGNFDVLNVSGIAALDGTLTASSFGGFTPAAANSFQVLNFGSVTGAFAASNLTIGAPPVALVKVFHANNLVLAAPGAPTQILPTGGSVQTTQVNAPFGSTLQVTVTDAGGTPVSGVTVTFAAPAQSGASVTFAGSVTSAVTGLDGVATSAAITANSHAGAYQVSATGGGLGPVVFNLTNTAGPATNIAATAGTPQSAPVGTQFATALQATVTDSGGNPVSGVTVTFSAPVQTGASGTFAGGANTAVTGANGVATAPAFTANSHAGSYSVSASATGVVGTASFSLTNTGGAPASITATAGTPQSATIATVFATAFKATVRDGSGNLVVGATVTFTVPGSGASGAFAGGVNTAVTDASGVATAVAFTANSVAGSYNVIASSGAATTASFSVTNTPGAAASIAATAGTPQSATISTAFATALKATVKDASGNPVPGVTVTFAAPAQTGASGTFAGAVNTALTDASGVATAPTFTANSLVGSYSVTATATGAGTGATFSLTNSSGVPASITATAGTPQSAAIGTVFATVFKATVRDGGGNLVAGATVTFTAPGSGASGAFAGGVNTAVTDAGGVATAVAFTANTVAGSYNVIASSGAATTATFSMTNNPGAAASITATAGTPQSATVGTVFATALKATVKDASGNPVPGVTVTFTAPAQTGASGTFAGAVNTASTDASGVATAPAFTANTHSGAFAVTASVTGVGTSASYSLTNNAGAAATITATAGTPQTAVISTAFGTALKATVKDASGNLVSGVTVTFAAPGSGASGTFAGGVNTAVTDASGVAAAAAFTANSTAGTFTVNATATGVATPAAFSLTNVDFALGQVTSGTVQLTAGTPANVVLNVNTTPVGGMALPADVNYTCTVPAALTGTTCAMSPTKTSAGTIGGSTAANTTLMIMTTAILPPASQRRTPWPPYLPWAAATALAGLLAIFFGVRQKFAPLQGRAAYATVALLLITAGGLVGCATQLASTPKGASSVTVTSTSVGASKTTTVNINVN